MKRFWKWASLSVLIILIGYGAYLTYTIYDFSQDIQQTAPPKPEKGGSVATPIKVEEPPKWEGKERVNILLLGGDSRSVTQNVTPRSDSILVASLDPVTKKARLYSILRDTYVSIPDHGKERINAAYAIGGANLAVQTVSDFLGIPIQYYIYTDFRGFVALVDSLGGIDIDVEKDMYYTSIADGPYFDIDLKEGYQHLDGKTALGYVRFRHDATSDFTRTERQRKFMTAVADKMISTTTLLKLPKILKNLAPYIQTNISLTDMWKLGSLGYDMDNTQSQQLPPQDLIRSVTIGGASMLAADEDDLKAFIQDQFAQDAAVPETPAKPETDTSAAGDPGSLEENAAETN